jgi:MFS family permease
MDTETGTAPEALDDAARAALQRRTLRVLAVGQVIGAGALAAAVTVGAFVVQDILGQDTSWGGIATATVTVGTAFASQLLARRMRRVGRRPGLVQGYVTAIVGSLLAALAVQLGSLPLFIVGLLAFGQGQAANLLARYAATDLAPAEAKSRAMSRIVFASTFGAVGGPLLIAPGEHLAEHVLGIERYAGPWLLAAAFFVGAALNTALRLRPDPLVMAGGVDPAGPSGGPPPLGAALRAAAASPAGRLGLASMVVSQACMVAVMTMTPVHLKSHGHESLSAYVISLHIAGMFAFSPLVGRFADRKGRVAAIALGAVVLVAGTGLAAVAGDGELLLFPALWLLGVGWNLGLIGGSSLLSESVPASERVSVQGAADVLMSLCGGLAGFSSGFIRAAVGYPALSQGALVASALLLAAAAVTMQRRLVAPV